MTGKASRPDGPPPRRLLGKGSAVGAAAARSRVYALLSLVYRQEPDRELLAELGQPGLRAELSRCGLSLELLVRMGPSVPNRPWAQAQGGGVSDALLERLSVEFARLFLVPGPDRVPPFESVHAESGPKELYGPAAVDIVKFLEAIGLRLDKGPLLPDHVSVEFEIMRKLTEAEAAARGGQEPPVLGSVRRDPSAGEGGGQEPPVLGGADAVCARSSFRTGAAARRSPLAGGGGGRAGGFRKAQRLFLETHLGRWFPSFAAGVRKASPLPFYGSFTDFAERFVESESAALTGEGSREAALTDRETGEGPR